MNDSRISAEENNGKILSKSKKHWASFAIPVIIFLLGLLISTSNSFYILGLFLIGLAIHRILENKTVSWELTSDVLTMKGGYLPWRKMHYEMPLEEIYESYSELSFWGKMLGYRSIFIRRTDGSTSYFVQTQMDNAEDFAKDINSFVNDLKRREKEQNQPIQNNISISDELLKLNDLKEKGILSQEEFETQKQKLIG